MPGVFFKALAATTSSTHPPVGLWLGLFNFASPTQEGRTTYPGHACEILHAALSVLGG
jgi:hypothetical protein